MGIAEILASIDHEISTLQRAHTLIAAGAGRGRKIGRPSKATVAATAPAIGLTKRSKKRNLSPEGRKRIAEAQKRRWETIRKARAGRK
jgi:hypothetical protein